MSSSPLEDLRSAAIAQRMSWHGFQAHIHIRIFRNGKHDNNLSLNFKPFQKNLLTKKSPPYMNIRSKWNTNIYENVNPINRWA